MDRKKALPLLEEVMEIRASVEQEGDWLFKEWDSTPIREGYRNSARNLAYYMGLQTEGYEGTAGKTDSLGCFVAWASGGGCARYTECGHPDTRLHRG